MTALPPVPVPFLFNAWLEEWHDADTGLYRVDRGVRDYSTWSVRTQGIACRELDDPGGPEARDWLAGHLTVGSPVVLATVKPYKYRDGKVARIFYEQVPGVTSDLAEVLILEGWALPWNGKGKQPKPPWPRPSGPDWVEATV